MEQRYRQKQQISVVYKIVFPKDAVKFPVKRNDVALFSTIAGLPPVTLLIKDCDTA